MHPADVRRAKLRRERDQARTDRDASLHPLVRLVLEHDRIYTAHLDRRTSDLWCADCGEQAVPRGEVRCVLCGSEQVEPFRVGWD